MVLGAAKIAVGVLAVVGTLGLATPVAVMLIASGAGMMLAGIGTLIAGDQASGLATATRGSKAPWNICYGRCRVGGTVVYQRTWGTNNQMLDMVFVLAAHPCKSVDTLLFDQQRIIISTSQVPPGTVVAGSGTSRTPINIAYNISTIVRDAHGVVTVTLPSNIPTLLAGDQILIQNVGSDLSLNGLVQVSEIVSRVVGPPGSIAFTYLSGGATSSITLQGQAITTLPDYGKDVYFEILDGTQTLGTTFRGMIDGTPWQGGSELVSPEYPGSAGSSGFLGLSHINPIPNPWSHYCSLTNKTAVFLRLKQSTNFKQGIPQISFLIHGKDDIFDPRTGTTGYSENSALCIADYLSNTEFGFKSVYGTDIPTDPLIAAANVCDQSVTLVHGSEPRYTCNGQFPLTTKRGELLQNLLTSCAGRLTYYGGQFIVQPAYGPSDFSALSPPVDLQALSVGPMKWRPSVSVKDLYNGCKGTYISPDNKWQSTDFPGYAQDSDHGYFGPSEYGGDINLAADSGDRRWLDIQLPFTISAATAQRIAKIELLRRRHQGTGTFILNMAAYQYVPLDVIQANVDFFGWTPAVDGGKISTTKTLEISAVRLRTDKQAGDSGQDVMVLSTEIDVQETNSNIYQWSTEEQLTPQGYVQGSFGHANFIETVPYPWSPGYVSPLAGDAIGGPASFGIQPAYGVDAEGNAIVQLLIKGASPFNALDTEISSPYTTSTVVNSGGTLAVGKYVVGLSAWDAGDASRNNTDYLDLDVVNVTVANSSITVNIDWGSGDDGGDLYIAKWVPNNWYTFHHNQIVSAGATSATVTTFDQSKAGGPDPLFDQFGVIWLSEVHAGVWAEQVQVVTAKTITIGGNGMTTNQWAGYTLSLLAKLDHTVEIPLLNMPVLSSTASTGTPPEFTLTIGPNAESVQLPDLTTLLVLGDLVTMRYKATFTDTTLFDANIANSYYPHGANDVEAGDVAIALSGADTGDIKTLADPIESSPGSGIFDTFTLTTPWTTRPATGDIVVICKPSQAPEVQSGKWSVNNALLIGTVAKPDVANLANSTWLFRVRTDDKADNHCDDSLTPFRELYLFGAKSPTSSPAFAPARPKYGLIQLKNIEVDTPTSQGTSQIHAIYFYVDELKVEKYLTLTGDVDGTTDPVVISATENAPGATKYNAFAVDDFVIWNDPSGYEIGRITAVSGTDYTIARHWTGDTDATHATLHSLISSHSTGIELYKLDVKHDYTQSKTGSLVSLPVDVSSDAAVIPNDITTVLPNACVAGAMTASVSGGSTSAWTVHNFANPSVFNIDVGLPSMPGIRTEDGASYYLGPFSGELIAGYESVPIVATTWGSIRCAYANIGTPSSGAPVVVSLLILYPGDTTWSTLAICHVPAGAFNNWGTGPTPTQLNNPYSNSTVGGSSLWPPLSSGSSAHRCVEGDSQIKFRIESVGSTSPGSDLLFCLQT